MFGVMSKDRTFYGEMEQLGRHVALAAGKLHELAGSLPRPGRQADQISDVEMLADDVTQSALSQLESANSHSPNRTQTQQLLTDLYGVIESIEGLARRVVLFHLSDVSYGTDQQIDRLHRMADQLSELLGRLLAGESGVQLESATRQLNALAEQAKGDRHAAMVRLMNSQLDPLDRLKRREVLELAGRAINRCEHAVQTLQQIMTPRGRSLASA